MAGTRELILETQGLEKRFGGIQAVNRVSLAVGGGDVRAVIGPNGAGKTTLFNLITGEVRRDKGRILFEGKEIGRLSPPQICLGGIARTFQITSIFRWMSVLENVQTSLLTHHGRHWNIFIPARNLFRDAALALLERVGLVEQAGKPGGILAHGDRKRLELAIALAGQPRLLMLDEPTAGMTPRERHRIIELVARLAADLGLTVLFTEHDMDVVFATATVISVMHQGAIIAEGKPAEVRTNPEVRRVYLGEEVPA